MTLKFFLPFATFIIFYCSPILANTFLCTVENRVGFGSHDEKKWDGFIDRDRTKSDVFYLRPPTPEDNEILKKFPLIDDGTYPYVLRLREERLQLILTACSRGFNSHGYIKCNEGIGEFEFFFPTKRFIKRNVGSYLMGNGDAAETLSLGSCISF